MFPNIYRSHIKKCQIPKQVLKAGHIPKQVLKAGQILQSYYLVLLFKLLANQRKTFKDGKPEIMTKGQVFASHFRAHTTMVINVLSTPVGAQSVRNYIHEATPPKD